MRSQRFGLSCALALPFNDHAEVDYSRLTTHAKRCLAAGCSSVTLFGTTGEGASVSLVERQRILDEFVAAGVNLRQQVFGGVVAASVGDAVQQALALIDHDCRGILLAPPFYFKDVKEAGLYNWFSQVFAKLGELARDVILYHIPSVTGIELSVSLIRRLKAAFPGVVTGVKDSGVDWTYTENLLKTDDDLLILIGNEKHLSAGIRLGAHGAISGLANVCPDILLEQIETGKDDDLRIAELASEILRLPFVPAIKALLAEMHKDPVWLNVRPPLVALSEDDAACLVNAFHRIVVS
jgi:4-hydroxy-tetrahydrodipicolinate synthase